MSVGKKVQQHQRSKNSPQVAPPPQPNTSHGGVTTVTAQRVEFQGPLPPPDILIQYNDIQPGFAERIVAMAEREQAHRHSLEETVVTSSFKEAQRGQKYGLSIGVVAIIAGAITAVAGAPVTGSIIGGGGVIGLVSVFVLGRFFPTSKPGGPAE